MRTLQEIRKDARVHQNGTPKVDSSTGLLGVRRRLLDDVLDLLDRVDALESEVRLHEQLHDAYQLLVRDVEQLLTELEAASQRVAG